MKKQESMRRGKRKNQLQEEIAARRQRWLHWIMGSGLLLALLGVTGYGISRLLDPNVLPMRSVIVEGNFRHLDPQKLQKVVGQQVQGNFFSVDITRVQKQVERMPWVDQVMVRRKWPDTLVIRIEEQHALARWSSGGLVNVRGEWFDAKTDESLEALPVLGGPEGTVPVLTQHYQDFSAQLAQMDVHISRLVMNDRRSWQLELNNGLVLVLGRSVVEARLRRFLRMYPRVIVEQLARIEGVDMRYTNGFAVRWKPEQEKPDVVTGGNQKNV